MQHSRINREKGVGAARRSPGGLTCVVSDGLEPAQAEARQRYLDAIHIPAAVVAMEGDQLTAIARNQTFVGIAQGRTGRDLGQLVSLVRAFLISGAHQHDCAWEEPGVGGRHFRVHLTRLPSYGHHDERAMLSLVDRTAEVETQRSLRAEMLLDTLTGLPNRLAFEEAIDRAINDGAEQDGFAVLSVDLVRFSRINECIGALAGDELILTVARRLVSALRAGDLLARLAGDEFGVLMRVSDGLEDALHAARRLQHALASPVRLSDLEIRIDCAIGCASWNDRTPTSGDLMRNAQVALKRAKASGRVEIYQPGEVSLARRRFSLESDLRRAIERDELSLAFQPLVHLESGVVSGFEALARWNHETLGAISPVEFISVAEESGLIVPLGRWAMNAAAQTLLDWDRQTGMTLPLQFCVNVSPVQLARDALFDMVASTLRAHGLGGERITLELTESAIVADPESARRVLHGLHDLGCRVAMDDFGTGYSSLAQLQKLPIDVLKIDRSLVTDMHDDRDSVAIIRAILSLAQALGMSTTAEGIETAQAGRTLQALGCTTGQGYYYARPLASADALAYFLANRA